MVEGVKPNEIVQGQTDIVVGRPTQHHHNCNAMRLRNHYDKSTADPQTKVNILTLVAGGQQTHNKALWEVCLDIELGHLQIAAELFKKYEGRDPEEVVGSKVVIPCRFQSQKDYVRKVLVNEVDKRLDTEMGYTTIAELPEDWPSYKIQERANEISSPTENSIRLVQIYHDRDIVETGDKFEEKEVKILEKGLQKEGVADNTVMPDELEDMIQLHEERKEEKEELI